VKTSLFYLKEIAARSGGACHCVCCGADPCGIAAVFFFSTRWRDQAKPATACAAEQHAACKISYFIMYSENL